MNKSLLAATLATSCFVATQSTYAVVLASDNFESYSTGALNGDNGGTGFSGAYSAQTLITVANKSLIYSNGSININGGNNAVSVGKVDAAGAIYRQLSSTITANTVYMSFLLTINTSGPVPEAFLQFGLGTAGNAEPKVSVGIQGNQGDPSSFPNSKENFFARAGAGTSPTGSTVNVAGDAIPADTVYLVVAKITKSTPGAANPYNKVQLFVNPSSIDEPATATLTTTDFTSSLTSSFDYFDLRTARRGQADDANTDIYFDNLIIGTTFADVVGAVPEPASLGLLATGAALLAARKRR